MSSPVPHGFYPALTHFTDAITALPREFRRHNSLLKEVDAKAWALEDNLLQLLKAASESQPTPYPPNAAPIIEGVVREDLLPAVSSAKLTKSMQFTNYMVVDRNLPVRPNPRRARTAASFSIVFDIPSPTL